MKHLSLLGLHVLKVTVEAGTFCAAAQLLNISQPAVSGHIHRIENELDVKIFKRPYDRKLKLTEAGKLVYTYAIEMLVKNDELQQVIRELVQEDPGQVKFALSIGRYIISPILAAFRNLYPWIYFIVRSGNDARIQKLVLNGEVDFGLSLYTDNPQIDLKPFYYEPIVMVCSSIHPLASKKYVSKEDLNQYELIGGLQGSDYNRFIKNFLIARGIHYAKILAQVDDQELVIKLVKVGKAISLLPRSVVNESIERGEMVDLSFSNNEKIPIMKAYQLFRQGTRLNAAERLFLEFLYTEITIRFPFISLF